VRLAVGELNVNVVEVPVTPVFGLGPVGVGDTTVVSAEHVVLEPLNNSTV
jgi:hypothetical protein